MKSPFDYATENAAKLAALNNKFNIGNRCSVHVPDCKTSRPQVILNSGTQEDREWITATFGRGGWTPAEGVGKWMGGEKIIDGICVFLFCASIVRTGDTISIDVHPEREAGITLPAGSVKEKCEVSE